MKESSTCFQLRSASEAALAALGRRLEGGGRARGHVRQGERPLRARGGGLAKKTFGIEVRMEKCLDREGAQERQDGHAVRPQPTALIVSAVERPSPSNAARP